MALGDGWSYRRVDNEFNNSVDRVIDGASNEFLLGARADIQDVQNGHLGGKGKGMSTNPVDVITTATASIARQIEAEDFRDLFEGISPAMMCHDAATQD